MFTALYLQINFKVWLIMGAVHHSPKWRLQLKTEIEITPFRVTILGRWGLKYQDYIQPAAGDNSCTIKYN